jgi:putative PIN family toxin of toxin-antitoxin system
MTRVVLDVNILVSAALNDRGLPARVADMVFEGRYELAVSDHIIEKLSEVLERPYLLAHLSTAGRQRILRALNKDVVPVTPDESVRGIAADLEDDLVLGTAVAANAEFLVTGDKGLLAIREHRGVRIVTAEEFLREMERA